MFNWVPMARSGRGFAFLVGRRLQILPPQGHVVVLTTPVLDLLKLDDCGFGHLFAVFLPFFLLGHLVHITHPHTDFFPRP